MESTPHRTHSILAIAKFQVRIETAAYLPYNLSSIVDEGKLATPSFVGMKGKADSSQWLLKLVALQGRR